jgi:hypothetical protein
VLVVVPLLALEGVALQQLLTETVLELSAL